MTAPGSVAVAERRAGGAGDRRHLNQPDGRRHPRVLRREVKFDRADAEVTQVSFFTGPFGVYDALKTNSGEDNVVLSSGWGAANVSLLLSYLEATGSTDPDLTKPLYILDNNVARPNGGFGTRYPVFAVIGVNPIPTPEAPGVSVVDVGYEYDINGNTPAYVLNPVAMANSLATYFDNRLNQNDVNLPVDENGDLVYTGTDCEGSCQTKIANGDEAEFTLSTGETVRVKKVEGTTYISYRTDGLPLLQPLRQYGGEPGDRFADAVEPALKAAVDYGYPDNDALANPDRYEPVRLVPTAKETQTFARDFGQGVRDGLETLDDDPDTTTSRTTTRLAKKKPAPQVEERSNGSTTARSEEGQARRPGEFGDQGDRQETHQARETRQAQRVHREGFAETRRPTSDQPSLRFLRLTPTLPHSEKPRTRTHGAPGEPSPSTLWSKEPITPTPVQVDVHLRRHQDRLSTEDRVRADLHLGCGEVGVAQVDHAAAEQSERRHPSRHVPAAPPFEPAHDRHQHRRRRRPARTPAAGAGHRAGEVGAEKCQLVVGLGRVRLGQPALVFTHRQATLRSRIRQELRHLNAIGVSSTHGTVLRRWAAHNSTSLRRTLAHARVFAEM